MKTANPRQLRLGERALMLAYHARPSWVEVSRGGQRDRQNRDAAWWAAYRAGLEVSVVRTDGESCTVVRWAGGTLS